MKSIKSLRGLPLEEYFVSGHTACASCGPAITMRIITKAAGKNTIIVGTTGCMEVVSSKYPTTSWKQPWIHGAFQNSAAIASGINAALKAQGKRNKINIMVISGDGSVDIGLAAISGAFERGDKFTYICYDNEQYANTGMQRSGLTPLYAWTSTTPIGKVIRGKQRPKKPITDIIAAHKIPYIATATTGFPNDLFNKVKKSFTFDGPSFIHILTPCILGWKYETDPSLTIKLSKLAVETGMWLLYEIENGVFNLNIKPAMKPVEEYLKLQGRFKHLSKKELIDIQEQVNKNYEHLISLIGKKKINEASKQ